MAGDARISTALPSHPKTKKLIRRHGAAAAWHLVCLFLWVADNKSDGDLSGMSDEDIELAADWPGDEGVFVAALADIGFLDGEEGSRSVHDWAEHNPWAAGADDRSKSSKWAALCKRYGRKGAAERMPDYAARMRPASGPQESACAPDAELCDPHATRTDPHAAGTNPQCPVTVSDTDTVPNTDTETKSPRTPPKGASRKKLPDDFSLTSERRQLAVRYWAGRGRGDLSPEDEFAKFLAHHRSRGTRMADWDSAWITWYSNAVTYSRPPLRAVSSDPDFGAMV